MKTLVKSVLLAGLLAVPAAARAQTTHGFVAPYIGATFRGGDLAKNGGLTMGVSGGWMGAKWWGIEGDAADTSGFFEQDTFRSERRVTTVMGNIMVAIPMGSMRSDSALKPYAVGGFGLIKPHLAEAGNLASIDLEQGGYDVGAGIAWMKHGKGIRGDVRYFRSTGDTANDTNAFDLEVSTLHFLRTTVGLVVGF